LLLASGELVRFGAETVEPSSDENDRHKKFPPLSRKTTESSPLGRRVKVGSFRSTPAGSSIGNRSHSPISPRANDIVALLSRRTYSHSPSGVGSGGKLLIALLVKIGRAHV